MPNHSQAGRIAGVELARLSANPEKPMLLSKLYGRIFQSAVLPALLAPTRSRTTKLYRRMRKMQRWPTERIAEYQTSRLRELLELAGRHSPFYRERWQATGLSALDFAGLDDIRKFPITCKDDLEANFPDGLAIAARRSPDWQYVGTRGTTRRVMVIHDFERRDHERAAIMVALTEDSPYRYGMREVSIPPDACSVHCGIESSRAASVSEQLLAMATRRVAWNRESISDLRGLVMDDWICAKTALPPLPPEATDKELRTCVDAIYKQRPMQLTALPEYLRALADFILRTGDLPPAIPVIRPMGANFPKAWKAGIESAFRGQLREHYGSREMGPMAFDCGQANGLHLLMSQHIVEVMRNGKPVADGEVGKVLVTDLHNLSMPIIRYEIGDLARIDSTPCACGRTTPRIHLEGRVDDAFVLHDGRILTADAVANFFTIEVAVRDFELTEQNNAWGLRLAWMPGVAQDEVGVGERFLAWTGEMRRISVRTTQSILPEASGKYRHCKSRSFQRIQA